MTALSRPQDELYRAYSASYASAGSRRDYGFVADAAFALMAVTIVVAGALDQADDARAIATRWTPLFALAWLGVRELHLFEGTRVRRQQAVNIQEQFDLSFWKSTDWNRVWNPLLLGEPVPPRTIRELASGFVGEVIDRTYWVDTRGLPPADAALARILQTAGWGERGHRRYGDLNMAGAAAGFALVVVVSAVGGLETLDLVAATTAVAPLLTGRLNAGRAHRRLATARRTLEKHVESTLSDVSSRPSDQDVRIAQDELVRLRLQEHRIPQWIYRRYQARDQNAIDAAAEAQVSRLRPGP